MHKHEKRKSNITDEDEESKERICEATDHVELRPKIQPPEDEEKEKLRTDQKTDGGWSWAVLLGVFVIMMMNQLLAPSFGVMFGDYIKEHEIKTSGVTWIFNVQTFTWNIFGFLVGPLCNLFGWRRVTIIGSLLTATSIIITAFTTQQYQLFFSYSVLSGIGGSLTTTVCLFILPHYWNKRIGLANGFMMIGSCIGSFLSPQVITLLHEELQFRNSMIVIGCLFVINCLAGLLFRPKESAMDKINTPTATSFSTIGLLAFSSSLTTGVVAGLDRNSYPVSRRRKVYKFLNSFPLIRQLMESITKSVKVLQQFRAVVIALVASLVFNSYFNTLALIPIIMKSKWKSSTISAWTLSINAASSLIGRCIISGISDLKIFKNKKGLIIMLGMFLLVGSLFGFIYIDDSTVQLAMMGLQGLGGGIVISLYPLIIIDYMGLQYLPNTFGVASLFVAFGSIIIGPLIGYIKDATDDYNVILKILSGLTFAGFVICFFMPLAQKHDRSRAPDNDTQNKGASKTEQGGLSVGTYRRSVIEV